MTHDTCHKPDDDDGENGHHRYDVGETEKIYNIGDTDDDDDGHPRQHIGHLHPRPS